MNKSIMAISNFYNKKFFFDKEKFILPTKIYDDVKLMLLNLAELTGGIVSLGFYDDGELFINATKDTQDFSYDEIGAVLEVKRVMSAEQELIFMLEEWFDLYYTEEGLLKKEDFLNGFNS